VFAGTTNEHGWHKDETGGRRFWPWICKGAIDLPWLKKFRDQLFAEAKARYDRGEKWWDIPGDDQNEHVMSHYTSDPWKDRIEQAIASWRVYDGGRSGVEAVAGDPSEHEMDRHWGTLVTTNRIATVALQLPIERQARNTSTRIARCMRELGWDHGVARVKSGNKTEVVRAWICNTSFDDNQLKIDDKLL
jgi:predicted P-loop ATPase